ncbi:MAG: PilZ domain-containing protein [Thermoanaerobaculales bacterium]
MTERRAVPRVEPHQQMKAKVKTSLPARIVDISSRGVQLEVTNSLRPQVPCDIRIQLGDGEVTLRAMVRRCRAWAFGLNDADQRVLLYRAGLEFGEIDPESLARLSKNVFFGRSGPVAGVEGDPAGVAVVAEPESIGAPPARTPRRDGPVKIRISAEHVRKILRGSKNP